MNIIDAWKAAKEGQKIVKRSWQLGDYILRHKDSSIQEIKMARAGVNHNALSPVELLADDWEVMKEKKIITEKWKDTWNHRRGDSIPWSAKVTIEWEE